MTYLEGRDAGSRSERLGSTGPCIQSSVTQVGGQRDPDSGR